MEEEKDLNYWIRSAQETNLSGARADNFFRTAGLNQEDYDLAMQKLAETNPSLRPQQRPLQSFIDSAASEEESVWEGISDSFGTGKKGAEYSSALNSIVAEGRSGEEVDLEETREFMALIEKQNSLGTSKRMKGFETRYGAYSDADEDEGLLSELNAARAALFDVFAEEGSDEGWATLAEVMAGSFGGMAEKIKIIAGGTAAGAAVGGTMGATGFAVGPVGFASTTAGVLIGGANGLGASMAVVGGILEAQGSVAEFVMDELKDRGLEYNEENLNTILNDDDAMWNVTKRSASRGITIGTVELATQFIGAKGVGGIGRTLRRAPGMVRKGVQATAGVAVEAVGGGLGEIAGSAAAGQKTTGKDVLFEAFAGTSTAPLTVAKGILRSPKYLLNGERVSAKNISRLIEESDDHQLSGMKIEIKNDPFMSKLYSERKADFNESVNIRKENKELIDRLEEEDLNEFVAAKKELNKAKNSKLPTAKETIAKIEAKIEEISSRAKETPISPEVSATDATNTESVVESAPVDDSESTSTQAKPEAERNSQGRQLSLFDESQEDDEGNVVQDPPKEAGGRQPLVGSDTEETSNFVDIDVKNATDQDLMAEGIPTVFANLLTNVLRNAFKPFIGKLPNATVRIHKTQGSLNKDAREFQGAVLEEGDTVFGFVERKKDGSRVIHLLDVTDAKVAKEIADKRIKADSPTELVVEEILTHFMLESLMADASVRGRLVAQLSSLMTGNTTLMRVVSERVAEYFPMPTKDITDKEGNPLSKEAYMRQILGNDIVERMYRGALTKADLQAVLRKIPGRDDVKTAENKATLEEEIIAGFFRSYDKNPNQYRSVWQIIADFINKTFGKNVINSETDLRQMARSISRAVGGEEISFDPGEAKQTAGARMSKKSDFTYLKDTQVYYDFNRQSDVKYSDWIYSSRNIQIDKIVPQKLNVKDYFHFRNWYNKITANQEYPGIVTNMYFIKDGKKHVVNPPKPKTDRAGKRVKMERIPTFSQLKRNRQAENEAQDTELRIQYSELGKEVGNLWYNSPLSMHTNMSDFTPEGATESLDFEGQVIAKKNIQAAIDSGITSEQLKEMKGRSSVVFKKDHPELFNMSGLERILESEDISLEGSDGSVIDPIASGFDINTAKESKDSKALFAKKSKKTVGRKDIKPVFLIVQYDPGKTGPFKIGGKTYQTRGGVEEHGVFSDEMEGVATSHADKNEVTKASNKFKKYWDIKYNYEEVIADILKRKKEIEEKGVKKDITKINFELKETERMRAHLEGSSEISVLVALNKAKSLTARPEVFKAMMDHAIDYFEGRPEAEQKIFLDDFTQAVNKQAISKRSLTVLDWFKRFGVGVETLERVLPDGRIEEVKTIESFDVVRAIVNKLSDPQEGIFEGRDSVINALKVYNSKNKKYSTIPIEYYVKNEKGELIFPFSQDVAESLIDEQFKEVVLSSQESGTTNGTRWQKYHRKIYAVMTVNLDQMFTTLGAPRNTPKREGSSFPFGLKGKVDIHPLDIPIALPESDVLQGRGIVSGEALRFGSPEFLFSKASGRVSKKLVDMAGEKGVSTNQVLQIMGKATEAERAVLEDMMGVFAGTKYIPKEDFDAYFKGAMLQQVEETDQYARVGIDNILRGAATRAFAATVTFAGREELYGTPLSTHFPYGTHAHLRFFNTADDPSSFYVMEMQSDSFQVGDRKESFMDQEELMDEVYELFGVTTENMDFVKDIANNPRKQLEVFNPANITTPSRRSTLSMQIGNAPAPLAVQTVTYWWDMLVKLGRLTPEEEIQEASIENLYAVAKKKEGFSEANADAALRFFAIASLKAPIDISSADARKLFEKEFFETEEAVARAGGDPVAPENLQLKHFYLNAWKPKMESVGEEIPSMFLEIQEALESEEDGVGETMGSKLETLQRYEEQKESKSKTPVDPVKSAEKSWERQLIREALKRAQDLEKPFVRFATEETAQEIQGWGALDGTLGFNEDFAPTTYDFRAIRKRYRKLPQTLSKMGLEAQEVTDQLGNSWVQVDTPPRDQRFVMFSKSNPKNNLGQIGGAVWEQKTQSRTEDLKDLWLVRLQDKYRRVFKLQEDVAAVSKGQVRESQDFRLAEETMYGKAANDLDMLDQKTDSIVKAMKKEGVSVEQIDEYLYALHAKERNAVIRERTEGANDAGSGKTDAWADGILNGLSKDQRASLEAVSSLVREIQQDTRNSMVELGLETQETIDAFEDMFENYIPLQGLARDEDSVAFSPYPSGGTGFSVSGRSTKKAKGRVSEASNILAQVVSQNAAVKIKGRTNEAMNSLYNLVEANPNTAVWETLDKEDNKYRDDDPNIVSVRVNGVQKAIRFRDASYAESLRTMNLPNTNRFIKFLGTLNSWLRAAFTSRNPEFILSNFSRDIQSAIFNASAESEIEGGFLNGTGAMKRIFKMVGPSLKALVKEEVGAKGDPLIMKYYAEFKEDGGKTGWAYQKSLEVLASELEIDDSGKTSAQKLLATPKRALDFIEGMNDAFENSIRLSSYIAAREGGVSRAKAAQFAKNITVNFNKQGEWGAAMNATYLFFNASVQGTARLGRSLTKMKPAVAPDGSTRKWRERATNAQKAAIGLVILNGMLTLLAQAGSDEDEDGELFYNKIPDYIKERNLIIMRPDGENYWKIPMPYGYNIFANIGTAAVETAAGHKTPMEATMFLAGSTINAFAPISFGQSEDLVTKGVKSLVPTAMKPLVDVAVNETYFGGPVKAEQYPFGTPKPNSSMSFRSPEEIKQFFSWMNEATGGSSVVPGTLDINPDGYWYILEYYMGGIGKFIDRSIETTRKVASATEETPIDLDFNDVPMARIIYGEPSKYYDFQKFKDREVEIKQLIKEYKEERKPNSGDRYKAIGTLEAYLKNTNKALKLIREAKRKARQEPDYATRVSRVQELMEKERKLVMKFNQQYNKLRGE
jgi:hypothetical protein